MTQGVFPKVIFYSITMTESLQKIVGKLHHQVERKTKYENSA
jgi:hypothetical protein